MLLYIMLYIVLAYLMLFAALSNAVCLYNASYLPMISAIAFYFHVLICIMHCAFNLLVFPNSMFTPLLFFY